MYACQIPYTEHIYSVGHIYIQRDTNLPIQMYKDLHSLYSTMMGKGAGKEPLKLSRIILLSIAIGVASIGYTEGKHHKQRPRRIHISVDWKCVDHFRDIRYWWGRGTFGFLI